MMQGQKDRNAERKASALHDSEALRQNVRAERRGRKGLFSQPVRLSSRKDLLNKALGKVKSINQWDSEKGNTAASEKGGGRSVAKRKLILFL